MAGTLGFDVAAGMYQSTFNAVLSQVYTALYPDLLKDVKIDVNEAGISSVDVDIQDPPAITLMPSEDANAYCAAALETALQQAQKGAGFVSMAASDKSVILANLSSATFTANFPKMALAINYTNGGEPTNVPSVSLAAHAIVSVDGSNSDMTFKILGGAISVPNNPVMTELLNKALLPFLIDYLNTTIFGPIKIPPLGFKNLAISAPLPVVQQSYFTAFSALGSTPSSVPAPLPWPKDGVYIAADIPALEAAAGTFFPLGAQESFSWNIFSGQVGATVNTPTISGINADGSVNAAISANASCQLTMQMPWPFNYVSFGPSATASLACTLRPLVEDGELKVVPEGVPIPNFSFNWGIPDWANWIFQPLEAGLAAALNAILGPLVAKLLNIPGIPILQVPAIPIKYVDGKNINITIEKATPSGLDSMLVISAQPSVQVSNY